jgi:8-oxo-dGTP pyrophosphatase MutT (NUDIX family)
MKLASAAELEAVLHDYRPSHRWSVGGRLPAAVCVPLQESDRGPQGWAIKRAAGLRHHSRELAFPGGKPEPEDGSLLETALRETEEELGFGRRQLVVLGELAAVPTATSRFALRPFICLVEPLRGRQHVRRHRPHPG